MGTKRTKGTGKFDSMGREVKVSGMNTSNHDAKAKQFPALRLGSSEIELLEETFVDYLNVKRGDTIDVDGEQWNVLEVKNFPYTNVLVESPNNSHYVLTSDWGKENFVTPAMVYKDLVNVHPVSSYDEVVVDSDDFVDTLQKARDRIMELKESHPYIDSDYRIKKVNEVEEKFKSDKGGFLCFAHNLYNVREPDIYQDEEYPTRSHSNNLSAEVDPSLSKEFITIGGREFFSTFEKDSEGNGGNQMMLAKVNGDLVLSSKNGHKIYEVDYDNEVVEVRHIWEEVDLD